ncbi:MAG TPA: PilZ domain-containing protein [Candidatus Lustribacter sp.]|jgi:c-di-GMP-binding flagellar brake protein YcgR|nr:PilZ domain-containing protein [Candidatus Lustribacter sp.]
MLNFFGSPNKKKPSPGVRRPERRAEARVDTSVSAEWRFKPVGKIASSWATVVLNDLSRTGATMTCDRVLKPQEAIEIRTLLDGKAPIVFDTVIVRCEAAGPKFKVGMMFRHVDEESSHVITRFINKRMTELRGRGLV